jgi:hypothetical protein
MMLHGLLKWCNAVHWLSLTLWVAALAAAGIAAMNVFGTLPKLNLTLNEYQSLPPESHGRLAAGMVMEGVFFVVDLAQFVAAPLALITLLFQLSVFRMPLRRPANLIRTLCIVVATGLFAFHATVLAPRMNRELRAYWRSAQDGEIDQAQLHLAKFNEKHPVANTLLQTNLILLLIAIASTSAAVMPSSQRRHRFESPALLKRQ